MTRQNFKNKKTDVNFSNLSMKSSLIGLVLVSLIVITAIAVAMPDHYRSHIKLKLRTALLMEDQKYAFIDPSEAVLDGTRALQEEELVKKRQQGEFQQQKLIQEQLRLFHQFQQFQAQANAANFIQSPGIAARVAGQPIAPVAGQPSGPIAGQPAGPIARQPAGPIVRQHPAVQAVGILPAARAVPAAGVAMNAEEDLNAKGRTVLDAAAQIDGDDGDSEQSPAEYKAMLRNMIKKAVKGTKPLPAAEINQMAKQISKDVPFVLVSDSAALLQVCAGVIVESNGAFCLAQN
jgi:hypothetical protein